jgi:hypothetical protein
VSRRSSCLRNGRLTGVGGNGEEVVRWDRQQEIEDLVPFSVWRRDCIGRHLAVAEMKTFIARLVGGGFEVEVEGEERIRWGDNVVSYYEGDMRVRIWKREERTRDMWGLAETGSHEDLKKNS